MPKRKKMTEGEKILNKYVEQSSDGDQFLVDWKKLARAIDRAICRGPEGAFKAYVHICTDGTPAVQRMAFTPETAKERAFYAFTKPNIRPVRVWVKGGKL